jgi:hypothetical protein
MPRLISRSDNGQAKGSLLTLQLVGERLALLHPPLQPGEVIALAGDGADDGGELIIAGGG